MDDAASAHGRRMAAALRHDTPVEWLLPSLQLPQDLAATEARVLALPLRVRSGNDEDRFTRDLVRVIRRLRERGRLVFVAKGPHPNPLADVAIAISASPDRPCDTASQACVVAAERVARRLNQLRTQPNG